MEFDNQLGIIYLRIDDLLTSPGTKIIAIDGNSGAGKSFLACRIADRYDCNVFHMDDFFLPPEKKTADRLAEAGGNVDRERFLKEILNPVRNGAGFVYHRYDCRSLSMQESAIIQPKKLNVVEGAYSMHPDLFPFYDFSIFLGIEAEEQSARILNRSGPLLHKRFLEEWIPLENHYFSELKIKEKCDVAIMV